jgi:hypothetical protein
MRRDKIQSHENADMKQRIYSYFCATLILVVVLTKSRFMSQWKYFSGPRARAGRLKIFTLIQTDWLSVVIQNRYSTEVNIKYLQFGAW